MFQVGDTVRYGQSGICKIEEICDMTFGGTTQRYYVLMPLFKMGSMVYVPVENAELVSRMLPPLTREEVDSAIRAVREKKVEWIRDFRRRSEFAKKALSSGDRTEALYLIKSIYHHKKEIMGQGARIHTTDDYFLKDAETLIFNEFSFVLDRSYEDIAAEVRSVITEE
ncbi:MAG: CarD family transcriptional regulator [Clostridia bacterium]|nr:CarD family transcriptional regulator [Clostridia bacterium]